MMAAGERLAGCLQAGVLQDVHTAGWFASTDAERYKLTTCVTLEEGVSGVR
jgi:hypothetical protein